MCGCTFHAECITAYCDQAHTTVLDMKCPVCRQTADTVATIEAATQQNLDPGAAVAEPAPAAAIEAPGAAIAELAAAVPAAADAAAAGNDRLFGEVLSMEAEAAVAEGVAPDAVVAAPASGAVGADGTATEVETEENNELVVATMRRPTATDGVYPEGETQCSKCLSYVAKAKVRCVNKTKQLYQCHVCGCRISQLNRAFGVWPTSDFKAISAEEKVAFMNAVADCTDADQVKLVAQEFLRRYEKKARFYMHNGEFLPLSVWANRGFDATRIELTTKPTDTMEHPVLGKCYRVAIVATGSKGEIGWERQSAANATNGDVQPALQIMPAPAQPVANADSEKTEKKRKANADKADGDGSSSDSDSSSSSSDDKATLAAKAKRAKAKEAKRSKKAEKKRKAAAAADAKLEKERSNAEKKANLQSEKESKKKKRVAEQLVKKLMPVIGALQSSLSQPQTIQAPMPIVTRAQHDLAALDDHVKRAQLVKTNPNNALPCDLAAVATLITQAKLSNNVLASMISNITRLEATMARHGIAGA